MHPTDKRMLVLAAALHSEYTIDRLYELTKIDKWFLHKFKNITDHITRLQKYKGKVNSNLSRNVRKCTF